ncbi:hypothetical protein EDD11_007775 [Mortierella claussenii]|nr:hypothetical protein EDD11_007775 [Mortierella claussenii]
MATIAPTPTTKSTLPSPLPTGLRTHIGSDRALLSPSHGSDISEVPLDAFAEGEVLETEISDHDRDHHQHWGNRNSSSSTASTSSTSPYSLNSSSAQLRIVGARCSSSTLFDESRPSSSDQTSWSKPDSGIEIQKASPALFRPPSTPTFQLRPSEQKHAFEDASTPKNQQQHQPIVANVLSVDQKQRPQQCQNKINMNDSVLQSNGQAHSTTDDSSSTHSATPAVASSASPFKIEPSPSVRLSPSSHGAERQHSKGSGSPLHVPTTPMAPTSAEMDKPTKNLMIFNQIPRQWPSSQETLHYNYVTKNTSKKMPMVIKDFDPATAERIDRVINKERPLSRAAKERLAAEQKEAEAEARGFFDPARRWKGRDVYPRPANWVYCRRTKNNWLEKTKILADQYKLFKGQVLGKGHHADVYKGIDLITGQDLAIKVIYKTVTRRLGFVNEDPMQEVKNRRLLNEAWFIDYLKDAPGVCKMLRVIETATKFYFVMELAQSDLNSYSNGINMREEEIRHILKPIFECLKHAHSRDITHRDIKPENILLRIKKDWLPTNGTIKIDAPSHHATKGGGKKHERQQQKQQHQLHHIEDSTTATNNSSTLSNMLVHESSFMDADSTMDNGDDRSSMDSSTLYNYDHRFDAFLADWGLAVEHDCNSGRKPVGTPLYAAPEVVRKMKRIRRREWINYRACDIWSLGVTMFVVASGIYPYHTHDALEAQSPPNWAALESSGMSQEYIAFTQRLMNLTAEQRPSAAEACNDPWLQG